MNHRLADIAIGDEDYPYMLTFQRTLTSAGKKTYVLQAEAAITARAKKVILIMPRRSLELIHCPLFGGPWLDANFGRS